MNYSPKIRRHKRKKNRHEVSDQQLRNTQPQANATDIQLLRDEPESLQDKQMIALQRDFGNSFVQRQMGRVGKGTVIQRMPAKSEVLAALGAPHKDKKKVFGGTKAMSTKYKDVLKALGDFETYTMATILSPDPNEVRSQMLEVNSLLDNIYDKINAYEGKKNKKATYLLGRLGEVKEFQGVAARAFAEKIDNPDQHAHQFMGRTLTSFLNGAAQSTGAEPLMLDPNSKTGSARGGSKEVSKYDMGGDMEGYFAEMQNKLTTVVPWTPEWEELKAQMTAAMRIKGQEKGWDEQKIQDEIALAENAAMNEYYLGVSELNIDPDNAQLGNRNIAMSRLDQLLNTKMIARAQFATLFIEGGEDKEGTIMADAKGNSGFSPKDVKEDDSIVGNDAKKEKIGTDDPELMRQLSRLQLIDIIASQIDRNLGNYFIHRDTDGDLVGITGIDNDMSFGSANDASYATQQLPGITRYVDKELAETIISIDAAILAPLLGDLLPPDKIAAAIQRMKSLQDVLQSDLTNLLEPNEWDEHKAGILSEDNYFTRMTGDFDWQ